MGMPAEEKTAFLMSVLNTLDTSALDWNAIAAKNNITTNAAKKRWKRYKDSVEAKGAGGKATKGSDESDGGAEGEKTPKKRKRAVTTTPKKKAVATNVNQDGKADE